MNPLLSVVSSGFRVIESPQPLEMADGSPAMADVDESQGVIWTAPGLSDARRARVVRAAILQSQFRRWVQAAAAH